MRVDEDTCNQQQELLVRLVTENKVIFFKLLLLLLSRFHFCFYCYSYFYFYFHSSYPGTQGAARDLPEVPRLGT